MNALTKVLTTGLLAATAGATAQTEYVIEQGANYSEDVFFSLEAGVVATQPTGNWDLAFDVSSPFSNAVRINDGNGRALAVVPGVDISGWADVDTVGYSTWPTLYNGLDTWVNGAFNVGTSDDPSDFGWGTYSGPPLHQVIGDSIYVFTLEDGTAYKLRIDLLNMGVWTFTYAALDGSGETTATMNMADYAGRNFAYFDFETGWIDREPANWDFVFTRYVGPTQYGLFPTTGALLNAGRSASEADGVDPSAALLADYPVAPAEIGLIGNDWKELVDFAWQVVPDRTYFVESAAGEVYQITFTTFTGSSTGVTTFNAQPVAPNAVASPEAEPLAAFPNPIAGGTFRLEGLSGYADVEVLSVAGVRVARFEAVDACTIDAGNWAPGAYVVRVWDDAGLRTARVLKR